MSNNKFDPFQGGREQCYLPQCCKHAAGFSRVCFLKNSNQIQDHISVVSRPTCPPDKYPEESESLKQTNVEESSKTPTRGNVGETFTVTRTPGHCSRLSKKRKQSASPTFLAGCAQRNKVPIKPRLQNTTGVSTTPLTVACSRKDNAACETCTHSSLTSPDACMLHGCNEKLRMPLVDITSSSRV